MIASLNNRHIVRFARRNQVCRLRRPACPRSVRRAFLTSIAIDGQQVSVRPFSELDEMSSGGPVADRGPPACWPPSHRGARSTMAWRMRILSGRVPAGNHQRVEVVHGAPAPARQVGGHPPRRRALPRNCAPAVGADDRDHPRRPPAAPRADRSIRDLRIRLRRASRRALPVSVAPSLMFAILP